ncbi:MAG: acyl-CoA thioesterase [Chitinophagaceae bacterium]
MDVFEIPVQVRWSDMDPNFHLRHSVYYDWGAVCRVAYLEKSGLTWQRMTQLQIGPIIFREECIFKREIRMNDPVTVDMKLLKAKRDFSRFTIVHTIYKNPSTVSAILTVDIAWINGATRKLTVLPEEDRKELGAGPVAADFEWLD